MRRLLTQRCRGVGVGRSCHSVRPPKDPFDLIYGINTREDFERGVAQVHSALGSLLMFSPQMWEPTFGIREADRREFMTPVMLELLRQAPHARTLAAPDEHVLSVRIVEVSAEPRGVSLSTSDMDVSPGPPDVHWSRASTPSSRVRVTQQSGLELDPTDVPTTPFCTVEPAALSPSARERRAQGLVKDFNIRCKVELIVASPPERHCDPELLRFYMSRVEDADSRKEKLALARLLAVSQTAGVFKAIDWVTRKVFHSKLALYCDAIPLHVFRLPTNFFQLPPTVRKTMTFELTPRLNWAVSMVTVDPTALPFLPEDEAEGSSR
uniref:Uncharacterized protein n=1 Tax=Neobodo designis TaxID=312471 RepID=A0A7S1QYI7_NEODS|mmetsp:Transcript_54773/g.168793  ORF Transcript_54773/g.168793 Transcript_54773/m.168793 type:complete len:323 (+) Transcript_54773:29-997(+)|eukprot:CAMPEP_0174833562 /NCGR_PEP_ID=MMETSP1114-20130205/4310_1 /TAXON_ID=312471 /ORGANISM="Neobodo designis, Strain CCAP 1951/1" /LENGTH=322 /DNA_ID=CAMNT_0016067447 /DNA_START=29 /DNA_END=997 /DNA_ORIENTATION=-